MQTIEEILKEIEEKLYIKPNDMAFDTAVQAFKELLIRKALEAAGPHYGRCQRAAKLLSINETDLNMKRAKLGIK